MICFCLVVLLFVSKPGHSATRLGLTKLEAQRFR